MFSKACAAYPQIYPQISSSIAFASHDRFWRTQRLYPDEPAGRRL